MDVNGKAALVLGAVKGIGKSIGLALAGAGASVAVNYFDWQEELDGLRRDLAAAGRNHLILKTDLRARSVRWCGLRSTASAASTS